MSVTSMNSRMAMAEKLSIPQLQQAIKAGTVPAYVGIPLLQEKVKMQKSMQAAQQAPAGRPVAEGVMEEAEGISSIPSNLPVSSYGRDGGIAAFAEGGEVDGDDFDYEDYLEQEDMDEYEQTVNQYRLAVDQAMANKPQGYPVNRTPSVEGGLRSAPASQPAPASSVAPMSPAALPSVGRGPVSEAILKGAEAHNMPAEFLTRLSGPESSGNPNAKNPLSSAKGLYQFTDATWKAMGGEPGKQFDPYENAEKAAKLTRQNVDSLANTLGRTPTYAEAGMAHRFGSGVGKMLKTAEPDTPIEQGLRAFERPERVALIMKQNPDLRGKTVGDVLSFYEKKLGTETFADGGVVRMQDGGIPLLRRSAPTIGGRTRQLYDDPRTKDDEEKRDSWLSRAGHVPPGTEAGEVPPLPSWFANMSGVPPERYAETIGPQGMQPMETPPMPEPSSYNDYGINEMGGTGYGQVAIPGAAPRPESGNVPGIPPEISRGADGDGTVTRGETAKPRSQFESFMDEVRLNREDLKKQKEQDKYLSILAAGLGMMSGSSPNALANIGQGAQAGLATYASLGKQRAAENAALNKSMLTAQRYQSMEDIANRTADINERRYGDVLEATKEEKRLNAEIRAGNLDRQKLEDMGNLLQRRVNSYNSQLAKLDPYLNKDEYQRLIQQRDSDPYIQQYSTILDQMTSKMYGVSAPTPVAPAVTIPKGVTVRKVN